MLIYQIISCNKYLSKITYFITLTSNITIHDFTIQKSTKLKKIKKNKINICFYLNFSNTSFCFTKMKWNNSKFKQNKFDDNM